MPEQSRRHFHEPSFFITPKDVVALPTAEAVEQTYARVMADMPPDYVRTEFSPLSEHRLSDDLAMVSGSGVWKNAANEDSGRTRTVGASPGSYPLERVRAMGFGRSSTCPS